MSWRWPLAAAVLVPFIIAFFVLQIVTSSFEKLGLSAGGALLLYTGSLLGGWVNIPVWRRVVQLDRVGIAWPWDLMARSAWGGVPFRSRVFFYEPPRVGHQIIAVNLGGAVIPLVMSLYLLPRVPLLSALTATVGVAAACYLVAKPEPSVGIMMPLFVPAVAAALLALLTAPENAPPVAYISGTMGTLVGADLLHLPSLRKFGAQVLSIGGAGVHDGIFFAGLVAVLLS